MALRSRGKRLLQLALENEEDKVSSSQSLKTAVFIHKQRENATSNKGEEKENSDCENSAVDVNPCNKYNEKNASIPTHESTKGTTMYERSFVNLLKYDEENPAVPLTLQENTLANKGLSWNLSDEEDYVSSGTEYIPDSNEESSSSEICLSSDGNVSDKTCPQRAHISPVIPVLEPMLWNGDEAINTPSSAQIRRVRRNHRCLFCDQDIGNFSRHLERNHTDEIAVQEIMSLKKNSNKRKKLLDKLRREGDFCTSNIVPVMSVKTNVKVNYIACKFCRGHYSNKSLRRHAKKCFFNPDPSKRFKAQMEGQTLMVGPFGPNDPLRVSGILNMMRADDVSMVAKKDAIICEVGRRYIRSHKEKHLLLVAKRNMRRLSRLLISVRSLEKNSTFGMIDILTPHTFKTLVRATHEIAEYDHITRTFQSPSLALQMGTLLKSAINTAYSLEVQKVTASNARLDQLKALLTLIETEWAHEISCETGQNLAINKFNKPTLIPVTEDIMKFEKYLKNLIIKSKTRLVVDSKDVKAYRELLDGIFCSVMIFNKRRVGELQRMNISIFLKNYETTSSSEFEKALSDSEKILYKSLKRVVIRGKRGRGVPVLFDKMIVEAIEFLIHLRSNFDLDNNDYLFGLPGTTNPITGTAIMRKHAKLALGDGNKASLLTSTKLRKHLATIVQILKMEKNELEQLATFMGHTEKTHAEFYRLPDDVYQTAKVSKLLLLAKGNSLEKYKGKRLKDIEIDDAIVEDEGTDEENDDCNGSVDNNLTGLTESNQDKNDDMAEDKDPAAKMIKIKRGGKRTLVPWTEKQKKMTEEFFKNHIKGNIPPKKQEVMKLIEKYPKVFDNKSWQVIKVYVCNKYSKK